MTLNTGAVERFLELIFQSNVAVIPPEVAAAKLLLVSCFSHKFDLKKKKKKKTPEKLHSRGIFSMWNERY